MDAERPQPIRMVIADDHEIFLDSLCSLLEREPHLNVVGRAKSGTSLYETIVTEQPDLVITDLSMPGRSVVQLIPSVLEKQPELGVIVLSMYDEVTMIVELLDAGVRGYLLKQAGKAQLLRAISVVHEGGNYFTKEVEDKLIKRSEQTYSDPPTTPPHFSKREIEIIKMIYGQMASKEIADQLGLTKRAVDSLRERIQHRIGAKNMIGIVLYALKTGIAKLDE